jgi:PilZ domain-containing protein
MESSDSGGRDRRRYERFEFDGFAEVISFHPEVLFRGAVRDISLTGCYVETRARLNLKRLAEIELRFSAHGQQLSALARVMDVRPGKGIGVEFVPGDPRMNKRFRDLIEELKARSQIHAERELHGRGERTY